MKLIEECRALNDDDLENALKFLASRERHNLAKLLAHMAEYDRRQLCVKRGHSTLFFYCMQALGYDEGGAYRRIRAARVARRWPEILDLVEGGGLHLTALIVLAPILNDANRKDLFAKARGKSRRELETMVAAMMPHPPQPDYTRRLPVAGGWSVAVTSPTHVVEALPASRPWEWQAIVPIALDRVRIGFDAGVAVMGLIDRARQVLRHKYPQGRLEDVMKEALEIFLDRKDPQRRLGLVATPAAAAAQPRFVRAMAAGRYVPAWVKKAVWQRDGGRCAWRFPDGTLCGSKDWIEFDHVRPFAKGGRSDSPRNIRLLCRAHNRLAAEAEGLKLGGGASGDPACSAGRATPCAPRPCG